MNILLVERDRATRRLIKDMMVKAGATLTEADTAFDPGASAGATISLAIVEVEADGAGLAAIGRVRQGGPEGLAILALAVEPGLATACHAAGANEVLVEPVPLTALFDAIVRLMPATCS